MQATTGECSVPVICRQHGFPLVPPDLWLFQSSCPLFCDGPRALWGGSGGNIDVLA